MNDDQRQKVVANLNGRNQINAFEAAKAVWQDPDKRIELDLIRILKHGHRPFNRAAAAFAMHVVSSRKTIKALENTLRNRLESPRVRGEAAEALAHCHLPESHYVLLSVLKDRSKEVRFWCAFALGQMAEQRAITQLEQLAASDRRVLKGFHSVSKEAADAIQNIRSEKLSHRRRGRCMFCVNA